MELHDSHYVRAVTELSEKNKIVTHRDIYAGNGIKVVATGIRLSLKLYDRLVKHKLMPPLDLCLSIENAVDNLQILQDSLEIRTISAHSALLEKLLGAGDIYRQTILNIPLPPPLAFKLTVAKQQQPRIYQRSLLVMQFCIFLARCEGYSAEQEQQAATAGLFHELGMLHIDPAILDPSHEMTSLERQHLYTHPLTGYLLLKEIPEIAPAVADAVLEHHEHMDGSGYPRGLRGESISRYGQILGLSQLIARAFDPENPLDQWKQLEMMLKLNMRRYGPGLIGHLNPLFQASSEPDGTSKQQAIHELAEKVRLIGHIFSVLDTVKQNGDQEQAQEFAIGRAAGLGHGLLSAGFDYREPEVMIRWMEDDESLSEDFLALTSETIWQFKSLVMEILRRWPAYAESEWLSEIRSSLDTA